MPNQINNHYHLVQTAAHNILSEPSYFTKNLCARLCDLIRDRTKIKTRKLCYRKDDRAMHALWVH